MAKPKIKIQVKTTGFGELSAQFKKLRAMAETSIMKSGLQAGALVIQRAARANVREKLNKDPSGVLESQIEIRETAKTIQVGVWGLPYAAIHEFGGLIHAKTGSFLSFVVDGTRIFTKLVQIPARPYLRPAMDENQSEIKDEMGEAIKEEINHGLES